jgi:hypothetical protein
MNLWDLKDVVGAVTITTRISLSVRLRSDVNLRRCRRSLVRIHSPRIWTAQQWSNTSLTRYFCLKFMKEVANEPITLCRSDTFHSIDRPFF